MTPEVSFAILKTFYAFVYSFTKLIACDHEQTKPSKISKQHYTFLTAFHRQNEFTKMYIVYRES